MPGRGALRPRGGERQEVVLDVEIGEQQGQQDEVARQGSSPSPMSQADRSRVTQSRRGGSRRSRDSSSPRRHRGRSRSRSVVSRRREDVDEVRALAKRVKEQEKEMERLQKKREEKVVWKNKSCEFQYKYNDGVKDWIVEDLRRELELGDEIPESLEEVE